MKQHKSIKLEQDLLDKIEALAKKENRSFNNMVESILQLHFPLSPIFECDHEYTPFNNGTCGYTAKCHKCGHVPSPVIQTFHGGTVEIEIQ